MFDRLTNFATTGGLVMFVAIFAGVLIYALWPRNQERFDHAARMPLADDDDTPPEPATPKDHSHV